MPHILLFNLLQIAATLYALRKGGAPERVVGLALLAAAFSTRLLLSALPVRFAGVEVGAFSVDVMLLAVLVPVALYADRRWVHLVAALQTLGTSVHLAEAASPEATRLAYAILSAVWSYPILLILAIGTLRHDRRLAAHGRDLDWSRQDPTVE